MAILVGITIALSLLTVWLFDYFGLPLSARSTTVVTGFWLLVVWLTRMLLRWMHARHRSSSAQDIPPMLGLMIVLAVQTAQAQILNPVLIQDDPMVVACAANAFIAQAGKKVELEAWIGRGFRNPEMHWSTQVGKIVSESGSLANWQLPDYVPENNTGEALLTVTEGDKRVECSVRIPIVSDDTLSDPLEMAKAPLNPDQIEKAGYGFYNYLLLGRLPLPSEEPLVLEAMNAYLRSAANLYAMEPYFPKKKLSVLYIHVNKKPPRTILNTPDKLPRWVLDNYDLAKARYVLSRLKGEHRGLVYLVTSPNALSGDAKATFALLQELSYVPHEVLPQVIRHFLVQTARGEEASADRLYHLVLRARILIERLSGSLANVEESLQTWVKLFQIGQ